MFYNDNDYKISYKNTNRCINTKDHKSKEGHKRTKVETSKGKSDSLKERTKSITP